MRRRKVNRRQLLEILQADLRFPSSSPDALLPFDANGQLIEVVWEKGGGEGSIPNLLLVDRNQQRDFFAWTSAFIPWLRPITAFCRVLDAEVGEIVLETVPRQLPPKLANGCLGIVIGEAYVSRTNARNDGRVTMAQCLSTASFCTARAMCIGLSDDILTTISNWVDSRELLERRATPYAEAMKNVWLVISALMPRQTKHELSLDQELIGRCCMDIIETGLVSSRTWSRLNPTLTTVSKIESEMSGTREDRVLILERLINDVLHTEFLSKPIQEFVAGYLTSLVAPGTLDHIGLLQRVVTLLPASPLWYGFSAGVRGKEGVQSYANGLGRKLFREMVRNASVTDSPTCDIAMEELRVLARGQSSIPEFLGVPGSLTIEVSPCVDSLVRHSSIQSTAADEFTPLAELRDLTSRIQDISNRLDDVKRRLSRIAGGSRTDLPTKEPRRRGTNS